MTENDTDLPKCLRLTLVFSVTWIESITGEMADSLILSCRFHIYGQGQIGASIAAPCCTAGALGTVICVM